MITRGDLSFKRQPGARGPYRDSTYRYWQREETWIGKQSELSSWGAARQAGSAWSGDASLKLATAEFEYLEAGMVRVNLRYVGGSSDTQVVGGIVVHTPTSRLQRSLKTSSIESSQTRTYEQLTSYTEYFAGGGSGNWTPVTETITGETTISYLAPSITLRYSAAAIVKSHLHESLATSLLGGTSGLTEISSSFRASSAWASLPSPITTSGGEMAAYRSLQYSAPAAGSLSSPIMIPAEITCDPIGLSGWYQVEETWELSPQDG